jgi:single-stranded DNA-binding protein
VNHVALVGKVARQPLVRFEGAGVQTASFTLSVTEPGREGKPYHVYVPCMSWGRSAEACSLLNAEDLVAVSSKLTWRAQKAKCGEEHSQLCVSVREVAVIETAVAVSA